MSNPQPKPVVKRSADVEYETVGVTDGMSKDILVSKADGAPDFAIRRFVLDPGVSVPKHTSEVEHEQCVLPGRYITGIGDEEYEVEAGNSLLTPADVAHWYRNESNAEGAFLCAVPNGDDAIKLAADAGA